VSEPPAEPTQEQPAVTPTVSTAPPRSRWHWSAIPSHLGRARTSTIVLSVLFLAIGTLYLNVRPEDTGTATTGGDTGVQEPAQPTAPAEPTTPATSSTTEPPTTTEGPTTTTDQPTTTEGSTTSEAPTGRTTPPETTTSGVPTTTVPTVPTPTGTSAPSS
jgi:hypothetical protein